MIWKRIRETLRVVFAAFELTVKQSLTDSFVLFGILVQPLIIAILGIWMLKDRGGDYGIFVVVGSGMTGLWTNMVFMSGNSITQERWTGTLELLVAQPTPIQWIIFGKNLASVLQSLLSMVGSYLLAALIFNLPLKMAHPFYFAISLILGVISFICFGLVIAPIFVMNPSVQRWQNSMEYPIYILCGFLFPIALLPGWTTPISYLLSPYWTARALHGASSGSATFSEILLSWIMMLLFSIIYLVVSRVLFRVMLRKARIDASLIGQ
jgi:ABC-2 type transport system permease protein